MGFAGSVNCEASLIIKRRVSKKLGGVYKKYSFVRFVINLDKPKAR